MDLFFGALLIYLLIAGMVFTVRWVIWLTGNLKPKLSKTQLKETLKSLQKNGFMSLEEVIAYLSSSKAPRFIKNNIKKPLDLAQPNSSAEPKSSSLAENTNLQSTHIGPEAPAANDIDLVSTIQTPEAKYAEKTDTASTLLYVGAGLVITGALALVAFNWQNFTNLIKGLLILILTLGFYAGGIFTFSKPRIKSASLSLMAIASVLLALTGIGLWNFGIGDVWPGNFQSYWLIYSIGLTIVYALTARFTQRYNYNYFFLAALYSSVISLAFTLTNDNNFRIVIIAILNLLLYLSQRFFVELATTVRYTATILNQLLSLGIILIVYNNITGIRVDNVQLTAILAMLVPTIFNFWAHFVVKEKTLGFEGQVGLVALSVKLLLVGSIFNFNAALYCTTLLVYSIILIGVKYFILKPTGDTLDKLASRLIYLHTFGISALQILTSIEILHFDSLNSNLQLVYLTICWLILVTVTTLDQAMRVLQVANLLVVIIFNWLLVNIQPDASLDIFAGANFVLFCAGLGLSHVLNRSQFLWKKTTISPTIFALILSLAFTLVSINNWLGVWIFGLSCVIISIQARFNKLSRLSFIGFILELFSIKYAGALMWDYKLTSLENSAWLVYLLLFAMVIHTILADLEFEDKTLRSQNLLAKFILGLGAIIFCLDSEINLFILDLITLFVASLYLFVRRRLLAYIYILFGLSLWLNLEIVGKFNFALWQVLASYGFLIVIWELLASDLVNIKLENKEKQVAQGLSTGFNFLLLLAQLNYVFSEPKLESLVSILFVTIGLAIVGMKKPVFQYLSGWGLILMCWDYAQVYHLHSQFYVIPVTIYLLVIAYILNRRKQPNVKAFEFLGYNWQLITVLIQSLPSTTEGIYYSLVLIILSVGLTGFGLWRKNRQIVYNALGYLGLGLFIRLYIILLQIPWYLYLLAIGIGLIVGAIWWTNHRNRKI